MQKNLKKNIQHTRITEFAVHVKLTQCCKSTILQLKKKQTQGDRRMSEIDEGD